MWLFHDAVAKQRMKNTTPTQTPQNCHVAVSKKLKYGVGETQATRQYNRVFKIKSLILVLCTCFLPCQPPKTPFEHPHPPPQPSPTSPSPPPTRINPHERTWIKFNSDRKKDGQQQPLNNQYTNRTIVGEKRQKPAPSDRILPLAIVPRRPCRTHPQPFDRPESAWLCTSADMTSPSDAMKALRSSLLVPQDKFPTNTVLLLTGAAAACPVVKKKQHELNRNTHGKWITQMG